MYKNEKYDNYQYKDGLNDVSYYFNLYQDFCPKGLCKLGDYNHYFVDVKNVFKYISNGDHLREIILYIDDPKFTIVKDCDKWMSPRFILGKKYNLNDVETYKYLSSIGADINISDGCPIKIATERASLNRIKNLISVGANIHIDNEYPLRMAAEFKRLDVVEYLVSLGANIHAENEYALRMASKNSCLGLGIGIVKYLVLHGAYIHVENDYAFRMACESGHLEVVKYLVSVGADIHAEDDYGLRMASKNRRSEIVEYLVSL